MSNTNDRDAHIVILVMLLSILCYETMSDFVLHQELTTLAFKTD